MLLWYAVYCILVIVPFWILLPRYGIPAYAALVAAFPILAVLLLWLMAFGDKIGFGGDRK
ncbi:MAG: hypothetical protein AAGH73_05520 [Pseudomonadota bacterium]